MTGLDDWQHAMSLSLTSKLLAVEQLQLDYAILIHYRQSVAVVRMSHSTLSTSVNVAFAEVITL